MSQIFFSNKVDFSDVIFNFSNILCCFPSTLCLTGELWPLQFIYGSWQQLNILYHWQLLSCTFCGKYDVWESRLSNTVQLLIILHCPQVIRLLCWDINFVSLKVRWLFYNRLVCFSSFSDSKLLNYNPQSKAWYLVFAFLAPCITLWQTTWFCLPPQNQLAREGGITSDTSGQTSVRSGLWITDTKVVVCQCSADCPWNFS